MSFKGLPRGDGLLGSSCRRGRWLSFGGCSVGHDPVLRLQPKAICMYVCIIISPLAYFFFFIDFYDHHWDMVEGNTI